MRIQSPFTIYVLVLVALFGYIMPWVIVPSTPLTLGAYDLAEWASLHPSQPHTSPALLVPLLLRVQLLILTIISAVASTNDRKSRFISFIAVITLSVAQLPPLEFLIAESGNINYQQQMAFSTFSLILGLGVIFLLTDKIRGWMTMLISIAGTATAIIGLQEAQALYSMSLQEQQTGYGIAILILAYLGIILTMGRTIYSKSS